MELHSKFFMPKFEKQKDPPGENCLYSGKMELSNSNIKRFLIFSQKKSVLIFQKMENPKRNSLHFLKRKLFLYFAKWKPEKRFLIFQKTKLSYISGSNFPSPKNKKTHSEKIS